MFLALSESCPIFQATEERHLHAILNAVIAKRHVIVSPSPRRLGEILPYHVWRLYREYIRQTYKQSINAANWSRHDDCSQCRPDKLAIFYGMPLILIVENYGSDGGWVRLLIQKLRPGLLWAVKGPEPALDIRQAGGIGEIPKELRRAVALRASVTPPGASRRVVALADRDSPGPGQMSEPARMVMRAAEDLGASAHILQKRSIENYIPDEALIAYADKRAHHKYAVGYIVSLTGSARDYYPLKAGLSTAMLQTSDTFAEDSPVSVGMGDFMVDFLDTISHCVEAGDLRRRDGRGELDTFLNLLEENL